jgi:hypothetical protein
MFFPREIGLIWENPCIIMGEEDRTMSQLSCQKCGHEWKPRKDLTRYKRQCPLCNSGEIDTTSSLAVTTTKTMPTVMDTANGIFNLRTKLPPNVYDLVGITDTSTVENAVQKAIEVYRKLSQYKWKYNLESPEKVIEFLEEETAAAHKKANEAEKRLEDMLDSPELICYEAGGDLSAANYFETLKGRGYPKDFLGFVNEIVTAHFRENGWS